MSKGKSRFPTTAEIKRAIKACLDLGLTVTGFRADEHGFTVSTVPPSADAPPSTNEWDNEA
jgi:hypothetical protein